MGSLNGAIVRADWRGRLRYTEQQRDALLEAFARSGLSGSKFAELHGVKYQTLTGWVQRRRRAAKPRALPGPGALTLVEMAMPVAPDFKRSLDIIFWCKGKICSGVIARTRLPDTVTTASGELRCRSKRISGPRRPREYGRTDPGAPDSRTTTAGHAPRNFVTAWVREWTWSLR